MKLNVDKSLPLALHTQIVGAIERGILTGKYGRETPLPSVRVLSKELGVAPLTVSNAYQELKKRGLIETITGKGTYVISEMMEIDREQSIEHLRERFLVLWRDAEALGIPAAFFIGLMGNSVEQITVNLPIKIAMIGHSNRMNITYLEKIYEVLPEDQEIDSFTFSEFDVLEAENLQQYAMFVTIPHCIQHIRYRVRESVPILAPDLIPSNQTRMQLASLAVDMPILLVARYQAFFPAMLEGVKRFAPHVGEITVVTIDNPKLQRVVTRSKVVVYATGCQHKIQMLGLHNVAFEYQSAPEIRYLREVLVPEYQRLRHWEEY